MMGKDEKRATQQMNSRSTFDIPSISEFSYSSSCVSLECSVYTGEVEFSRKQKDGIGNTSALGCFVCVLGMLT